MVETDRTVLFSVNTDLDSWDYENLKYIRKISTLEEYKDTTLSYISGSPSPPLTVTHHNHQMQHEPPPMSRILEEHLPSPELTSCYLLDVLLVANESVFCQNTNKPPASPSASSTDSFASAIQKGFFEMKDGKEVVGDGKRIKNMVPKKSATTSASKGNEEVKSKKSLLPVPTRTLSSVSAVGSCRRPVQTLLSRPSGQLYRAQSMPKMKMRLDNDTLQHGYANNWAHLGKFVKHLNTLTATNSKC